MVSHGEKYEQLAQWHLRLNGYFTVRNFILHPDTPGSQRTDADVLGVRFPYSTEIAGSRFELDENLVLKDEKVDFVIAEVKAGKCRLNGPWTDPYKNNVSYVVKWMGFFKTGDGIKSVAKSLYETGRYEDEARVVRLLCYGSELSEDLPRAAIQLTHEQVLEFVTDRLKSNAHVKANHGQWGRFINDLWGKVVTESWNKQQLLKWLSSSE